jgi:hypothetical protein
VVCAKTIDRLDARGLHDLLAFLGSTVGGKATEQELAARLADLKEGESSNAPRERLAARLLEGEETTAAAP